AGGQKAFGEGQRAAIQRGQLRSVNLDERIVDAQPRKRGKQVLDGGNLNATVAERAAARRVANGLKACGNVAAARPEHDAMIRRCREYPAGYARTRVEPDAREGDVTRESLLA